ncbi:MAG: endonuclease/exonuclease/phosphatase family protein [Bacteroidales bacterium]|jgi:exonuclease III|nr:endonuclease/exonuclease/phosphatase family protein [Bacteroidales bacterium]
MKRLYTIAIALLAIFFTFNVNAQEKQYKVSTIAFYNLENLFDTINDPDIFLNDEFTPEGDKNYNTKIYEEKLERLSSVILKIGADLSKLPPAVVGISEVENATVIEDLINKTDLKKYGYDYVHVDGPDERGVDVAFMYRKSVFEVSDYKSIPLNFDFDKKDKTRDHLLVSGKFDGEPMYFIVNHWPSRSGGEKASRPKRNAAGDKTREIVDSLMALDKDAKIVVMGDFNDDPVNESLEDNLRAKRKKSELKEGDLFNPFAQLFRDGVGSGAYRDKWNLFDQVIISPSLALGEPETYKYYAAHVYNNPELTQREGRFKGYPWRTYVGDTYMGGYSDHFPAYIYVIKEIKE